MKTPHVAPAELLAAAEDRADAAAAARVAAGLSACAHCRRRFDDYRAVRAVWGRGFGSDAAASKADAAQEPQFGRGVDVAFDRIIAAAVRGPTRSRRTFDRARAFAPWIASGVAAALLVAVALRPDAPQAPTEALRAVVVWASAPEGLRSETDRAWHVDVVPDALCHLGVFALADGRVTAVYPDANPVIGAFGRTEPFVSGEPARLPPIASFDPVVAAAAPDPTVFIVASAAPIADAAAAADAATAAAKDGPESVRALLAGRYGRAVVAGR